MKKVFRFRPKLKVSGPVTDGSIFAARGIPVVIFGVEGKNHHSENEFVVADSIVKASKVYALSAIEYLGIEYLGE
jgi:acetylornithine deacetylase/succinyl-diaminopimelate desuccinylase-like protein